MTLLAVPPLGAQVRGRVRRFAEPPPSREVRLAHRRGCPRRARTGVVAAVLMRR